jgi:hypothetical protein
MDRKINATAIPASQAEGRKGGEGQYTDKLHLTGEYD